MRNPCGTIKTVKPGVAATHVAGEASPTVTITASVTKEAPDEPELKPCMQPIAVITASGVMPGG